MHWKHTVTNHEPSILAAFAQSYEWAADYASEQYYRALAAEDEAQMMDWSLRYVKLVNDQSDINFKVLRQRLIRMDLNLSLHNPNDEIVTIWKRGDHDLYVPEVNA